MEIREDELAHIGVARRSGRYPWGSGGEPYQNTATFLAAYHEMRKNGLSDAKIAEGMGMKSTDLRAYKTVAIDEERRAKTGRALVLREKGLSNVAIGKELGIAEGSVRNLLKASQDERESVLRGVADTLKMSVDKDGFIDVGKGVEHQLHISPEKLKSAIAIAEAEGYTVARFRTKQLNGEMTKRIVLAPPGTEWKDVVNNPGDIRNIGFYAEDSGRKLSGLTDPVSVNMKRVDVRWGPDGGADMDGVIELRRGVKDLDLGESAYAQVRIKVDNDSYLKGMAIYADDLPPGKDIRFNTNKDKSANPKDALKGLKDDEDNPFGAVVRQKTYVEGGREKTSALNIVNEEGDWREWSDTLSSQMLSKQPATLAKQQLDMASDKRRQDLDEILNLTNPSVKKRLLDSFADDADSAAVHLKAAALPRQGNHVLLPFKGVKENEIFAPNYKDGETVVLIRHPHGGIFEIPELVVNNKNRDAKRIIGADARDAVGINPKVAQKLSGADFDGDTVLVIPNPQTSRNRIKSSPPLEGLKDFDPKKYKLPGDSKMKDATKQKEMGVISNLITDMTIKGANDDELARAVRHSMVVIDAQKHNLDYQLSAQQNGISALKQRYQNSARGGASTLISSAKSPIYVLDRKQRPAAEGGPIDKKTGKKVFVETGARTKVRAVNPDTGEIAYVDGGPKTIRSRKMAETDDAFSLVSKNAKPIEVVYAKHANSLKGMANEARKERVNTRSAPYSKEAAVKYRVHVDELTSALRLAEANAPRERQAQTMAVAIVKAKRRDNPQWDKDDIKKAERMTLKELRARLGAKKDQIKITPDQWEAIQQGAISSSRLDKILQHADLDSVRQMATPKTTTVVSQATVSRARTMLKNGATQAEVANALGVSIGTLSNALYAKKGS